MEGNAAFFDLKVGGCSMYPKERVSLRREATVPGLSNVTADILSSSSWRNMKDVCCHVVEHLASPPRQESTTCPIPTQATPYCKGLLKGEHGNTSEMSCVIFATSHHVVRVDGALVYQSPESSRV